MEKVEKLRQKIEQKEREKDKWIFTVFGVCQYC
jgi:hypothetical protein